MKIGAVIEVLEERRVYHGLTNFELCRRAGISSRSMRQWRIKKVIPTIATLRPALQVVGVSLKIRALPQFEFEPADKVLRYTHFPINEYRTDEIFRFIELQRRNRQIGHREFALMCGNSKSLLSKWLRQGSTSSYDIVERTLNVLGYELFAEVN